MILIDTSAWVEYDRATGSRADRRIAELIADDGPLMFTEPVLMEVLAGARSDARENAAACRPAGCRDQAHIYENLTAKGSRKPK